MTEPLSDEEWEERRTWATAPTTSPWAPIFRRVFATHDQRIDELRAKNKQLRAELVIANRIVQRVMPDALEAMTADLAALTRKDTDGT